MVAGRDWLHYSPLISKDSMGCGLVAGRDWLHSTIIHNIRGVVADWSQAGIGYTSCSDQRTDSRVADWSQAGIGYTIAMLRPSQSKVADWSQAGIGYTRLIA